tara:strand:- start:2504 stop:3145 length:642 start_codon:yes stop_codon:yes gene_type:complete
MRATQLAPDGEQRHRVKTAVVGRYPLLNGYVATFLEGHAGAGAIHNYSQVGQLLENPEPGLDLLVVLADQYSHIAASDFSRVLERCSVRRSILIVEQGSTLTQEVLDRASMVVPMSVALQDFTWLMTQVSANRVPKLVFGLDSVRSLDPCVSIFTHKQRKVLSLLREGMSNKEIGMQMHVAEGTIKAHLRAIYSISGCKGRINTALMACRIIP